MKSENIIFYILKYGDLLFRKYWVYTYIFGFILLLSVVLVHLIDAFWWNKEKKIKLVWFVFHRKEIKLFGMRA